MQIVPRTLHLYDTKRDVWDVGEIQYHLQVRVLITARGKALMASRTHPSLLPEKQHVIDHSRTIPAYQGAIKHPTFQLRLFSFALIQESPSQQ